MQPSFSVSLGLNGEEAAIRLTGNDVAKTGWYDLHAVGQEYQVGDSLRIEEGSGATGFTNDEPPVNKRLSIFTLSPL